MRILFGKWGAAPFIVIVFCVLVAGACSPRIVHHYIYQRDTTYVAVAQVDSFLQRDSIFVREKGDTIYKYVEHWRDRYHAVHDTVVRVKVDSVVVEREKVVEVVKPLPRWQTFKIRAFWGLLAGLVLALVWIFRKQLLKLLKL